ncbi:MAG: hypothetical protein WCW25_02485 [Patescibacteria group bacterium]|jgi:hypothetical protein
MTRKEFIKKRKVLFWYIKNPENISDEVLVEFILNYGNWDDVKKLFKILGIKKSAEVFKGQAYKPRSNYRPEVKNYFKHYFARYA